MKLNLRQVYVTLFLVGIFFIPFNSFVGIKELGEFKKESGAYFLLLGFLIVMLDFFISKRVSLPYKSFIFQLMLMFLALCALSVFFNLSLISDNYYKKTSGMSRFVRQYFALFLSMVAFFALYWNVIVKMEIKEVLYTIRKVFLYSFIVVSIYGFLEILYKIFGFYPAYTLLRLFDYFPFTEYDSDANNRISSVCFEPPALGTYLLMVSGWMFSYILTNKGWLKYTPMGVVIILTYFSGSRTALVVILIQLLVFLYIILSRQQKLFAGLYVVAGIVLFSLFVGLSHGDKIIQDIDKKIESFDFRGNLKKSVSNQSRFGIQYANFMVFTDNPIFGVGFGQQVYQAMYYYPLWAKKDNWEFREMYLNKSNPMFPPGYNLYIRLLAEMGLVGFLFFCFFLYVILRETRQIIKNYVSEHDKVLAIILYVSFVGYIINWLQLDTFRMFGFWLGLAILIKLRQHNQSSINNKTIQ